MKCPSCRQRKGKRYCPGLRETICSTCCGEKRVVEIPCPADCPFLVSGGGYQTLRHYEKRLRGPDGELYGQVLFELGGVVTPLQQALVRARRLFADLSDQQALEAVGLVRKTCETEQRGILYEHQSPSPQVQAVVRELIAVVGELRTAGEKHPEPARLGQIVLCVRFLEKDIASMIEEGDSPHGYLKFLTALFPQREPSTPSIILP